MNSKPDCLTDCLNVEKAMKACLQSGGVDNNPTIEGERVYINKIQELTNSTEYGAWLQFGFLCG